MPGLTSIRPPPTLLLVSLHTRSELDIDSWRRGEPETFGHFDQIELVDVKDRPEAVAGVCLQIGSIAVFGGLEVVKNPWLAQSEWRVVCDGEYNGSGPGA